MLLKSSLLILLIINIFFSNLKILVLILGLCLILNFIYNKNLRKHLKRLRILMFFYVSTFLIQLYYGQEGKVLYKIYNFYITEEGLFNFGTNFIRILNLILLSWLINELKIITGKFVKYQKIIEIVIELVPQVFVLIKKKMSPRNFYRHILKKINEEYLKET